MTESNDHICAGKSFAVAEGSIYINFSYLRRTDNIVGDTAKPHSLEFSCVFFWGGGRCPVRKASDFCRINYY